MIPVQVYHALIHTLNLQFDTRSICLTSTIHGLQQKVGSQSNSEQSSGDKEDEVYEENAIRKYAMELNDYCTIGNKTRKMEVLGIFLVRRGAWNSAF